MPRNNQRPRGSQRPHLPHTQLIAQITSQPITTPKPSLPSPLLPAPPATKDNIHPPSTASFPLFQTAIPTLSFPDLSTLPDGVIFTAADSMSGGHESIQAEQSKLKDGRSFRVSDVTQKERVEELARGFGEMNREWGVRVGMCVERDGRVYVPVTARDANEEEEGKADPDGMTDEWRMERLKMELEKIKGVKALNMTMNTTPTFQGERYAANEEWTKGGYPDDIPTEPNSPVSSAPASPLPHPNILSAAQHVMKGYTRIGFLTQLHGLSHSEIRKAVMETNNAISVDLDGKAVLDEVVRLLTSEIESHGGEWGGAESDGGEADKSTQTQVGGKGKQNVVNFTVEHTTRLGDTGVIVKVGQTPSQALYQQWQRVREQVKKWEAEGFRMNAFDVYVEDGVVKKRKRREEGILGNLRRE